MPGAEFSHDKKKRQDNVIFETKTSVESGKRELRAAKVPAIVRINAPCGAFSDPSMQDNIVLQYYPTLIWDDYARVDNFLWCIRLRWAVSEGYDLWIDVQSVGTIWGRVHVVPYGMRLYSEAESSASEGMAHAWKDGWFYVKRFRFSN